MEDSAPRVSLLGLDTKKKKYLNLNNDLNLMSMCPRTLLYYSNANI